MSESNRPPHASESQRRTKRLRVPVEDVPRLSDRPPAMGATRSSNPPPSPEANAAAAAVAARTEAATVKMKTSPPPASVVSIMPSVVVSSAQVVLGTPSHPPSQMAAATEQMHRETHASILPPPKAPASNRPPKVIIDDSDDTLVEVPITMGTSPGTMVTPRVPSSPSSSAVTTTAMPPTVPEIPPDPAREARASMQPLPESVPPARLDDEDLADATEEDLKSAAAAAATPLAATPTGRMSMPGGAPPPPPARMSMPPPVPPAGTEAPAVVRLPPRKDASPASPPAQQAQPDAAAQDAKKKRKKSWWEEFFNDDFLRTVRPPSQEQVARQCDFLEKSLGLLRGAMILDIGCGLGLQAIELASRGYNVVGLDLSLPMLSRAADEAQDRGMKINFLHSDMKDMAFEGSFDAVLCLGTTFGYFDDESNRQVLERFRRALKPHGVLMVDSVNRDFVVQGQPNLVWFEGDGCVCMEETQFNFITSRLHVKRTMILEDREQRESEYSVRLYPLHELGQLMHNMGFRVTQVSGMEATPGVYFGAASPRLILLAERRPEGAQTGDVGKPPLPDEKTTPQAKRKSEPPV